jgi:ankyrin repeat protein
MKIRNFNDFVLNEQSLLEEEVQGDKAELTSKLVHLLDEMSKDADTIKGLINRGADVNAVDKESGGSVLHLAAMNNSLDLIEFCLKKGIPVDVTDKYKATPLSWASSSDALEAVQLLIKNGADIEAVDIDEMTALHHASYRNSIAVAKYLVSIGANVNAEDINGKTPIELAMEEKSKGAVKALSSSVDFANFEFDGKVYDFSKIIPQT